MQSKAPGVQLLLLIKEEAEQQECSSSVDQEGPGPPLIKEEDQLSLTGVEVKSEDDDVTSSFTQRIKPDAGGDDGGGPGPVRDLNTSLQPDPPRALCSESDTDDSEDWGESRNTQSGLTSVESQELPVNQEPVARKSLTCPGCGWKCSLQSELILHLKLSCSVCGACLGDRPSLLSHMQAHAGENPFTCSQCGNCFASRGGLKRHLLVHTGEKPFRCSHCGRAFAQTGSLNKHMRIHTGEKPFVCCKCGDCFAQRHMLNRHVANHTGEKPFSCSQCGKAFTVRGSLKLHMRVHTGEKPFCCSRCGKCFTRSYALKQHMVVHSG